MKNLAHHHKTRMIVVLKLIQQTTAENRVNTRADIKERPREIGMCNVTKNTYISDAVRLWNKAPEKITTSMSVYQAKREIRLFVNLLPI